MVWLAHPEMMSVACLLTTTSNGGCSALRKDLLLFAVHVGGGCEITPEIRSRASIII